MATRKPTQNSILIEIKKKQNISPRITINFPQSLGTFAIDFFLRHQLPQRLRRAVFYSWLPSPPTQKWARWASATSWGPSRQGPHGPPGCKISVGIDHLVVSVASLKKKTCQQKHTKTWSSQTSGWRQEFPSQQYSNIFQHSAETLV